MAAWGPSHIIAESGILSEGGTEGPVNKFPESAALPRSASAMKINHDVDWDARGAGGRTPRTAGRSKKSYTCGRRN